MKKIAFFVEGQTEQIFLLELIKNIAGKSGITFEIKEQIRKSLNTIEVISAENAEYYILIINCNTDNQVKSQINEQIESLATNNYEHIIGLKDAYPDFNIHELALARKYINKGLKSDERLKTTMHFSLMEIESWFIEEKKHFAKIDPRITAEAIKKLTGFDIETQNAEDLPCPADTLNQIYSIAGMAYRKRERQINRTVQNLCYETLYIDARSRSQSLDEFITRVEEAMFP